MTSAGPGGGTAAESAPRIAAATRDESIKSTVQECVRREGSEIEAAARHKLACGRHARLLGRWDTAHRESREARTEADRLRDEYGAARLRSELADAAEATAWSRRRAASGKVFAAYNDWRATRPEAAHGAHGEVT